MIKEKLQQHIDMLIDALNHNFKEGSNYSIAYNNCLRIEIELLETILKETN